MIRTSIASGRVTSLSTFLTPRRTKLSPQDHPGLPFVGLEHVEAHTMRLLGTVPAEEMKSAGNAFEKGDVLYSRLRPYLNKVWKADRRGICSGEFIVIPGNDKVDPGWLSYRLNSLDFVQFANRLNEGDRPRVDFSGISSFQTFLPSSLSNQKQVVDQIETQLSRLDAGVSGLRRAQANLKRYRAAVLKAACEGRLVPTEHSLAHADGHDYESGSELLNTILHARKTRWSRRGKYKEPVPVSHVPSVPLGWACATVDQLADLVTDGDHNPPPRQEAGVPHLTAKNIKNWSVVLEGSTFISEADAQRVFSRYRPQARDLIVTCVGTVGRTAIVPPDTYFSPDRNLAAVRVVEGGIDVRYLNFAISAPDQQDRIANASGSTAQPHLYLSDLKALPVALPPLAEQARIVAEVERRLSVVDQLEATITANLRRATRLRQSILAAAFSGPSEATA
jgi:type I restriction enzyme, S subunit